MISSKYELVPFSEVITLMHQGINTAADKVVYADKGTPIIQSKHFTSGELNLSDAKLLGKQDCLKYSEKYTPKEGDILFSNIGTVGKSIVLKQQPDFMFAWNVFLIRPNLDKLDSRYLKYYLDYLLKLNVYERWFTGGTVKFLNKKTIGALEIPLPPLPEQKRIAAILDKADQLRQKRQQAIGLADEFLRSVFLDMFGDPVTNPKGWEVRQLGDLLANIDSGWSPKCHPEPSKENHWGVLKLGAVTRGVYLGGENKTLPNEQEPKPSLEIQKGDLLFTRKNTYELVAATAYVHETSSYSRSFK